MLRFRQVIAMVLVSRETDIGEYVWLDGYLPSFGELKAKATSLLGIGDSLKWSGGRNEPAANADEVLAVLSERTRSDVKNRDAYLFLPRLDAGPWEGYLPHLETYIGEPRRADYRFMVFAYPTLESPGRGTADASGFAQLVGVQVRTDYDDPSSFLTDCYRVLDLVSEAYEMPQLLLDRTLRTRGYDPVSSIGRIWLPV